jgi:AraC-like DNA-binding protein
MRVHHAAGGTNSIGIPPSIFAMPQGQRMRYDLPDRRLADCVTGYAIYIGDDRAPLLNWYLPAHAMITILLDAGPVAVQFRHRRYADLNWASIWGATSHAYRTTTHGGISVGIGLTAEGWARLTAQSAGDWRDRVAPLSDLVDPAAVAPLVGALEALEDDAAIAPLLDRMLPPLFADERPEHAQVRAFGALVVTNGIIGVEDVANRLDIDPRALRRLATAHFGMPAKPLLIRARFVRSLVAWLSAGEPASYEGIDSSYFDKSHFLRDARSYLGTTPRRFAGLETSYLRASLRARAAVIGASAHALHAATPAPPR